MTTKCPVCNSDKLQKKGTRAGKQRYKCTKCGCSFTEGVPYKKGIVYEKKVDKVCPTCGGTYIIRDGKLPNGSQRYICRSCGLRFSDYTETHPKREAVYCPYCGAPLRYSGYGKKGQREFYCPTCKKSCSAGADGQPMKNIAFKEENVDLSCPVCSSHNISKRGSSKGKKRYFCNSCHRLFVENPERIVHSKNDAIAIVRRALKGENLHKLAEELHYSMDSVRRIIRPFYKNELASLTKEQKEMIIKYGHYLKVPVDYLAEYVPCSEHACRKILEKYRKKVTL